MCRTLEEYHLPRMITDVTGQLKVPFGDGVLATRDTVIGMDNTVVVSGSA
jgi:NAD+ synthase (glutamine-hydrolysing)